jgi:hypothetical protein
MSKKTFDKALSLAKITIKMVIFARYWPALRKLYL